MGATTDTINLSTIKACLGIDVTADLLSKLGFEPVARDKAARLYRADDYPRIARALIKYIWARADMQTTQGA